MPRFDTDLFMFGLPFVIPGAIFAIIGFLALRHARLMDERCTSSTEGIVSEQVDNTSDDDGDSTSHSWYFEVTYEVDCETFTISTKPSDDENRFHVGDRLTVEYDPADPDRSRLTVDADDNDRSGLRSMAAIGVFSFAIGAGAMIASFLLV
ncbi:DUF3592 domain-containing protein [Bifidobacterium vespertilionis]|nr:DUF3592 domain-containing protein [Bifidobacterium vespertilionis]